MPIPPYSSSPQAGYMGILVVNGYKIRVSSFGVNLEQSPLYYDHTIGLRDSIPKSLYEPKKEIGFQNTPQKNIYRPGVIIVNGSLSFPAQEESHPFLKLAKEGETFNMNYNRDCENLRTFYRCKVASYALAMTAGEVPTINVTIMGIDIEESTGNMPYITSSRQITWDACSIEADDISSDYIISFNMTITNDCKPIYTAGTNLSEQLKADEIRVGLQSVQGTITFYTPNKTFTYMDISGGEKTISIKIGPKAADSFKLNCIYVPVKRDGQPGPIVSTLGFYGVGSFWL